jgi:oxygen-dependent protoporphyrinogen oxidase
VRTDRLEGLVLERGAQNVLEAAGGPVYRLASDLGIASEIQYPREQENFIASHGRLFSAPAQLHRVLSIPALLRAGSGLVLPRRPSDCDQSVTSWASRRFGREFASRIIDPIISGVYAGDPERLSLEAAFPEIAEFDRKHRSLIAGAFRSKPQKRQPYTFRNGMGTLTEALAMRAGAALLTSTEALTIHIDPHAGYRIQTRDRHTRRLRPSIAARSVVIALPASRAAELVCGLDEGLARALRGIESAQLVSVNLAFAVTAFSRALPGGYGLVSPHCDGSRLLGCLLSSSAFEGFSSADRVLLRILVGGRRDPQASLLSDAELVKMIRAELNPLLGIKPDAQPAHVQIARHDPGLPQYEIGHITKVTTIEERLKHLPGIRLIGNSYRGISVWKVVEQAENLSSRVLIMSPAA